MRLRTDSLHIAGWKRSAELGARQVDPDDNDVSTHPDYAAIEPAQPGDVWILRNQNGGIVGYGLTCPNEACDQGAHAWDHARDCPHRYERDAPPCWTWTGSIEDGTLTATPSLHVVKEWGGCGWHGWLRNGEMVG